MSGSGPDLADLCRAEAQRPGHARRVDLGGPLGRAARPARPAGPGRPRRAWCRGWTASSWWRASRGPAGRRRRGTRPGSTPSRPGSPPTSFSAGQPGPAVERGVLHALGHHRPAGLLEPHGQLARARAARRGRGPSEHAQRAAVRAGCQPRGQPRAGLSLRPSASWLDGGPQRRLARDHVGAVHRHGADQLGEDRAQVAYRCSRPAPGGRSGPRAGPGGRPRRRAGRRRTSRRAAAATGANAAARR